MGKILLILMCVSVTVSIGATIYYAVTGKMPPDTTGLPATTAGGSTTSTTTSSGAATSSTAPAATTTTAIATTPASTSSASTCNTSSCAGVIASYLAKNWAYTSSSFGECANCPVVSYPNKLPGT